MSDNEFDLPSEAPQTVTSEAPRKRRGRPPKGAKGKEFAPDLDSYSAEDYKEVVYWVGALPSCPVEMVSCAGVNFPKLTGRWKPSPQDPGNLMMTPQTGGFHRFRKSDLERFKRSLSHLVVRFTEDPGQDLPDDMHGQHVRNVGDQWIRASKGRIVRIPRSEDLEKMKEQRIAGGPTTAVYHRDPRDEPAAKHIYAVPCEDQDNPQTGGAFPPSIYEAGLQWPGD